MFALTAVRAAEPAFDFVLRGGRIVDGSGNPAFHGDVAVKDGKIAAIGKIAGSGRRELDATGLVIAPGFIDVHTHAEDIEDRPLGENFLRMGVTTIVMGNCGTSALDVSDFFHKIEADTFSPNVATLVGHGTVRRAAMHGAFDRPPTGAELEKMRTLVRRGMEDGAVGFSTGLIYLPGTFAKTEELIELAKVAAAFDGIYATHQRSEAAEIFQSLDEIFCIKEERTVARNNTVRVYGRVIDIPPGPRRRSYAGSHVVVHRRYDGTVGVFLEGTRIGGEKPADDVESQPE